jgi:hypothetical protein
MQITLKINEIQASILQGCLKDTAAAILIDTGKGKLRNEQAQALHIECYTLVRLIQEAEREAVLRAS